MRIRRSKEYQPYLMKDVASKIKVEEQQELPPKKNIPLEPKTWSSAALDEARDDNLERRGGRRFRGHRHDRDGYEDTVLPDWEQQRSSSPTYGAPSSPRTAIEMELTTGYEHPLVKNDMIGKAVTPRGGRSWMPSFGNGKAKQQRNGSHTAPDHSTIATAAKHEKKGLFFLIRKRRGSNNGSSANQQQRQETSGQSTKIDERSLASAQNREALYRDTHDNHSGDDTASELFVGDYTRSYGDSCDVVTLVKLDIRPEESTLEDGTRSVLTRPSEQQSHNSQSSSSGTSTGLCGEDSFSDATSRQTDEGETEATVEECNPQSTPQKRTWEHSTSGQRSTSKQSDGSITGQKRTKSLSCNPRYSSPLSKVLGEGESKKSDLLAQWFNEDELSSLLSGLDADDTDRQMEDKSKRVSSQRRSSKRRSYRFPIYEGCNMCSFQIMELLSRSNYSSSSARSSDSCDDDDYHEDDDHEDDDEDAATVDSITRLHKFLNALVLKLEEWMPFEALVHSMDDSEQANMLPRSGQKIHMMGGTSTMARDIPHFFV